MNADRKSQIVSAVLYVVIGLGLIAGCAVILTSCAGAAPKPCSVAVEAQYTAELVEACRDAGSVEACGDAGAAIKARHEAEQEDAGCRVKP